MDYYLPTTLKLLNAYDRMDATGVSGENIDGTKRRVENIMDTIAAAFEKQLSSILTGSGFFSSTTGAAGGSAPSVSCGISA